jgi:hypothetical protein
MKTVAFRRNADVGIIIMETGTGEMGVRYANEVPIKAVALGSRLRISTVALHSTYTIKGRTRL